MIKCSSCTSQHVSCIKKLLLTLQFLLQFFQHNTANLLKILSVNSLCVAVALLWSTYSTFCEYSSLFVNTIHFLWILFTFCEYSSLFVNTLHFLWILFTFCEYSSLFVNTLHFLWILFTFCEYSSLFMNTLHFPTFKVNNFLVSFNNSYVHNNFHALCLRTYFALRLDKDSMILFQY